jgi:hypothetical protein
VTAPSREEILAATRILFEPGDVIELRALGVDGGSRTKSGYFDNLEALADAAACKV